MIGFILRNVKLHFYVLYTLIFVMGAWLVRKVTEIGFQV